ncbi:MAG: hypothetical protein N838_33030 [Thiohalocapsa sp. PB-PSB1]|jgi:hypothetical protein|nr:MAG: hypothetical protein N838_33030 [Thiohalocapsa sp. PB-PSB1]
MRPGIGGLMEEVIEAASQRLRLDEDRGNA